MMGMVVDNTHTRFGKFRIWLVIGTLVNSVVFVLLFHSFNLSGTALYVYVSVMYILYGMTYTIMDVPYWSWLPNLTNDPHEREKVSVIPRFFASLAGFSVATFGLYIINYLNKVAGESNLYAEKGYTLFAIIIAVIFIVTIGITVFNVKEESTLGVSSEKTSLKQAFQVIVKNDQLLAFIGLLLTFNLCTQLAKSFAVYYFKCVCHDEYLYSILDLRLLLRWQDLYSSRKSQKKSAVKSIRICMRTSDCRICTARCSRICSTTEQSVSYCMLCASFLWIRSFTWSNNMLYGRCYRLWRSEIWCTK